MVSTKYFCQNCKKELLENQKPCPFCGCENRDIKIAISETIKIRESLRGRQKRKGFKKFMVEFIQGWFPSRTREKFPEGVQKTRVIDKEKNQYSEKVIDQVTGQVMEDKKEKLTEHK